MPRLGIPGPLTGMPAALRAVAIHGNAVITAAGGRASRPPASAPIHVLAAVLFFGAKTGRRDDRIMAYYPVHQAATRRDDLGMGVLPCATRTRYPVHGSRKSGGEGTAPSQTPSTLQGADQLRADNPRWPAAL